MIKASINNRLDEIETATTDWAAKLDVIDYDWILDDYSEDRWEELHHDKTITVLRNKETGEVRGIYKERRTDAEIKAMGGDLAYL